MQEVHKHLAVLEALRMFGVLLSVHRSPFSVLRNDPSSTDLPPPPPVSDPYPCGPYLPLAFSLADPHLLCPQPLH